MLFGTSKNPKGPSLENPEQVVLDCSGTKVSFLLPMSNFKQPEFEEGVSDFNKGGGNITLDVDKIMPKNSEKKSFFGGVLIDRVYNFHGLPFWEGEIGGLTFNLTYLNSTKKDYIDNFYSTALSILNDAYHIKNTHQSYQYVYPIDWSCININDVDFLTYSIRDLAQLGRNRNRYILEYCLMLSSSSILNFSFDVEARLDSMCGEVISNIINFIIGSVVVNFSLHHLEEVKKADLKNKFEPVKPFLWQEYKKCYGVDYSILDQYR
ncbi:hypothetical protein [Marinibactrum halimedae]|uniref:Uncharacterized protein n=1 Tax=Marinibactrum halimedae TaxID=1444977 RepID=A0AA37WNK2_9GAMM|nr:hypothetical protein [Marinibactrum halimedae]MCD9461332.1 hypothetical protein [Marinibactrum halimedae]GLS28069.1 hypothetical protein GCM10007877_37880 [Marinibactrum halimedae]